MMPINALVCVMLCLLPLGEFARPKRATKCRDPSQSQQLEVLWSEGSANFAKSIAVTNNDMKQVAQQFAESVMMPQGSVEFIILEGTHIMPDRLSSDLGCFPWNKLPALQCGATVGEGAQGTVTLATYDVNCKNKTSGSTRDVAVKASKFKNSNPFLRTAAVNEIAVMELFSGSSLVTRIWDSAEDNSTVFILEEGVTGGTMTTFITEDHSDKEKALVFHDIAFGLQEMHKQKIVHRDLKPDNLLVTRETKRVKLADVSFSCAPENAAREGILKCDGMFGTPAYLAPEIYKQQADNMAVFQTGGEFRSDAWNTENDMWALGIILFQLIIGKEDPFDVFGNMEVGEFGYKPLSQVVQEFDIKAKMEEGDLAAKLQEMEQANSEAADVVKLLLQTLLSRKPKFRSTATAAAVLTRKWLTVLQAEEAYTQTLTDPEHGAPPACFKRLKDL